MNFYFAFMLVWFVFTAIFNIYNTFTEWPRSRLHKHIFYAWLVWDAGTVVVTFFHFHSA